MKQWPAQLSANIGVRSASFAIERVDVNGSLAHKTPAKRHAPSLIHWADDQMLLAA
jgi:hypothetical protein